MSLFDPIDLSASPFLTSLLDKHPQSAEHAQEKTWRSTLQTLYTALHHAALTEGDKDAFSILLRQTRQRAMAIIALIDLAGKAPLEDVLEALTAVADHTTQAALDFLLLKAHGEGRIALPDIQNPSLGCGYVLLAMGKQGAQELNFSSDSDLIALFDPDPPCRVEGFEPSVFYVRLTKHLIALLETQTSEGAVLRIDLRLRPDPLATQIALSLEAAGIYYETLGQNWERAAMIKARPAAGDLALGHAFLKRLEPYIWRKYLDYAAIADIQALKRQITHTHGTKPTVLGHNIKLGQGGIRAIEFFVQTQQLIAGGRTPALRGRKTLDMLQALSQLGWITARAQAELSQAYTFLRTVENRLQMQRDEQTHTLPKTWEAFDDFARFCGFENGQTFEMALSHTFRVVEKNYSALFEKSHNLAVEEGDLVFTGTAPDPQTLHTLERLGFRSPLSIWEMVRAWHFGHYRALQAARARGLLTELMPQLLKTFSKMPDPDGALAAFDRFLSHLPAGVQLFSLFRTHPFLLEFMVEILGLSPHLSRIISQKPRLFDTVLFPGFFTSLPDKQILQGELSALCPQDTPFEVFLDRLRLFQQEHFVKLSARILCQTLDAEEASGAYTTLAEVLLTHAFEKIHHEMASHHGVIPQGHLAVVALGRLGSGEMTATSDLDLLLVYDYPDTVSVSTGPKPLAPSAYAIRFAQKLIAALSAPTAEGIAYEIDLRLRPSGTKGPLATPLQGFEEYHAQSAWTFEKLALVRARVIAPEGAFQKTVTKALRTGLATPKSRAELFQDLREMRAKIQAEFKNTSPWDLKHHRGAILDIRLFLETICLCHTPLLDTLPSPASLKLLEALFAQKALSWADFCLLRETLSLDHTLLHLLHASIGREFHTQPIPPSLVPKILAITQTPSLEAAQSKLEDLHGATDTLITNFLTTHG